MSIQRESALTQDDWEKINEFNQAEDPTSDILWDGPAAEDETDDSGGKIHPLECWSWRMLLAKGTTVRELERRIGGCRSTIYTHARGECNCDHPVPKLSYDNGWHFDE